LKQAGITLLNQSVLLKKVNDTVATLEALSISLFESGILPYYLHHPDRAAGTRHFSIDGETGLRLWRELKGRLPGYLVPRYVIDVVGIPYKLDMEAYLKPDAGSRF
jgi:L-lysine 2,3-aminomutase